MTQIMDRIQHGDTSAAEELLPLVYEELRRLAAHRMASESSDQTLQATALVHEAWLRLTGDPNAKWENRRHFFGAAAEAMRRILIERARRKRAQRHGGNLQRVDVQQIDLAAESKDEELLAVNDSLERFAAQEKEKAELVRLRYFAGLTITEAAEALGISEPTAKRWWTYARAWLYSDLKSRTALQAPEN